MIGRAMALALATTALLLMIGCGSSETGDQTASRMAGACQTRFCSCQQERIGILTRVQKVPVLWQLNGDAYCPEGYELKFDSAG